MLRRWRQWCVAVAAAVLCNAVVVTSAPAAPVSAEASLGGGAPPLSTPFTQSHAFLTLLPEALGDGAACLDGSPPGFYFRPGYGAGADSWVLHLEEGGWCHDAADCHARAQSVKGSTVLRPSYRRLYNLQSGVPSENPDFFNWNMVYVVYCDGGSFAGNRSQPVTVNGAQLHMRGALNLRAVVSHLLHRRQLNAARQVILTGCSAGGLSTFLHVDWLASVLPATATVRGMGDAGFFVDVHTRNDTSRFLMRERMASMCDLHDCWAALPRSCVQGSVGAGGTWRCLFPQYFLHTVRTPLFVINSVVDTWQVVVAFDLGTTTINPAIARDVTRGFGDVMSIMSSVGHSLNGGGFWLTACLVHCVTLDERPDWVTATADGVTAADAFASWYWSSVGGQFVTTAVRLGPANTADDGVTYWKLSGAKDAEVMMAHKQCHIS